MHIAPAVLVAESFPALVPQDRAPGRHLSDITRSLAIGLGHIKEDNDAQMPIERMKLGLTFEMGFVRQLTHHYPDRYARFWDERYEKWDTGFQVEKDEIWMNLDLLRIDEAVPAVEDVKMTAKSARHDQEGAKWWEAWVRVKGYAWAVGARVGRLWIAHIFDYSSRFDGGDVVCRCWERRWDTPEGERELSNNWEMILREDRRMRMEGR